MLRLASVCGLALVAASLVAASGRSAPASPFASRIIDRTFLCGLQYGRVTVAASPRGATEVYGSRFTSSGYVRATSGSSGDLFSDIAAAARPGLRTATTRF